MTYSYEQRKKIRRSIREAEKNEFITSVDKERLTEAVGFMEKELAKAKGLLQKPVR